MMVPMAVTVTMTVTGQMVYSDFALSLWAYLGRCAAATSVMMGVVCALTARIPRIA